MWRWLRKKFDKGDFVLSMVEQGYPLELADFCRRMIAENKTHVAAHAVIEYLKMTDAEARKWFEEFEKLPREEQLHRQDEAMRMADEDIARKRKS